MRSLEDIRVLDLTQNLAGPFCAQILGDLGADVLKIEPPGGDPARAWGPPFWGDDSTLFLSANRNKRSVILDLKQDAGREALHRLARDADVFVQSSRVGVPERLGFDYASIRAVREDVIHMSITAYGPEGPLRQAPGYDPLMQAFSGIMSVTGHPDGAPARVGGSVVDFGTGMWAAIAILSAVRDRDRTGRGARLDTALLDTAVGWISYHVMGYLSTGVVPEPMGSGLDSIVPYQAFPTRNGHVMISGGNDAIFRRLCEGLDLPDLARDARFATNPKRVANRDALVARLEERTRALSTEELVERMHRHSVPCSPIRDIAEVAEDEQVEAAGLLTSAPRPGVPDYRDVSIGLRANGVRPRGEQPPPAPGEHTAEVLRGAGYAEDEVADLLAKGVAESAGPDGS